MFALPSVGSAAHEPPAILSPEPGSAVNTAVVTVHGTVAGDAALVRVFEGATILADVGPEGGFFTVGIGLPDGAHSITARARDAAGVWSAPSQSVTFTVDTEAPPTPVVTAPPDGALLAFDEVTVEGTAEPGARVLLSFDTVGELVARADAGGAWRVTHTFGDATHTFTAVAEDAAGNRSLPSGTMSFRVDTLAPAAPIIFTPGDGAVVRPTTIGITGQAEPGTTVTVSEGAPIGVTTADAAGAWAITVTLPEGTHTITARARDAAGHVSPESDPMTFRVDVTAPAVPVILTPAQDAIVPMNVVVSGTADAEVTVQLVTNGHVIAETRADRNGAWRIEMSWFSGPQSIRARARDAAGNLSALSAAREFLVDADPPTVEVTTPNLSVFLPTTPARLDGIARDNLGVLAIALHYFDATGRQVLRRNADCFDCPTGTRVDWFSRHGLPPGLYQVKVWAVDRAGNHSIEPAIVTFVEL